MFQFTLPCRERRSRLAGVSALAGFQFTLPCRERHVALVVDAAPEAFSIPAPV